MMVIVPRIAVVGGFNNTPIINFKHHEENHHPGVDLYDNPQKKQAKHNTEKKKKKKQQKKKNK